MPDVIQGPKSDAQRNRSYDPLTTPAPQILLSIGAMALLALSIQYIEADQRNSTALAIPVKATS